MLVVEEGISDIVEKLLLPIELSGGLICERFVGNNILSKTPDYFLVSNETINKIITREKLYI